MPLSPFSLPARSALAAIALVLPSTALAQSAGTPAPGEGVVIRIEPGYTRWNLDADRIQRQSGIPADDVRSALVEQTPNAPGVSLVLGYNIKGHASISAAVSGTGWDLEGKQRGGAGLAALELAWFPAQLVPKLAQRRWDVSFFGGAGYGVVGEKRAMDGLHYQVGARAEAYLTRWLSIGGAVRYSAFQFDRYVVNWDENVQVALPEKSGGGMWFPSFTLAIHAPVGG